MELRHFKARHRIWKRRRPGGKAYVVLRGQVQVIVIDEDNQEVVVDSPGQRRGLRAGVDAGGRAAPDDAPWRWRTPPRSRSSATTSARFSTASRWRASTCSQWSGASSTPPQDLVRMRAARNPNEVIAREPDLRRPHCRRGSPLRRLVVLHHHVRRRPGRLGERERDPGRAGVGSLSVHPAEPVPLDARRAPGAGDHDESESPGREGPRCAASSTSP